MLLCLSSVPSQEFGPSQHGARAQSQTTAVKASLILKVQLCCGTNIRLLPAHPLLSAIHYLNFIV